MEPIILKGDAAKAAAILGDGDGYGYGDGYGSCDGDGDGWLRVFESTAKIWTGEQKIRFDRAMVEASIIAFWKSSKLGFPCNGGNLSEPVFSGTIHEAAGPLVLCQEGVLHATMQPEKWKGDRLWIVALYGDFIQDGTKFGALKREILGEILAP